MTQKIRIIDLKIKNGIAYCSAQDAETGERIIAAELRHIMRAARERHYEVLDAQDVLAKLAENCDFSLTVRK
jgi:hypothetical protein